MNKISSLLMCLLFSFAGYAQINVKDSIQTILQNDTLDPKVRFTNAFNLILLNSSPEEAEALGMNVIYPFSQKTWKNKQTQLGNLAILQVMISWCYRNNGGDDRIEKERLYLEKAIQSALKSGNDTLCAICYNSGGYMEIARGDVSKGHDYLYKAVVFYDKVGQYVKSSEMLYAIATNFYEIKDAYGLYKVLQQMDENLKKDNSKQSLYQYNVLKHGYYDLLLEKEKKDKGTVDARLLDSMLLYIQNNIILVENHLSELGTHWMHGYAYYFLAKGLDDYCPTQSDSILFYLDKALDMEKKEPSYSKMLESAVGMEFRAFVTVIRARSLARQGKTLEAYKTMSEGLVLLDKLKDRKNMSVHRDYAYQFMVDYYEKANRPVEALKYQKLLAQSEAQRYENEKVQAINDMSVKYETEKKEVQIQTLTKEKRILQLTIGLSLAGLMITLLVILLSRWRRKNVEQQLYEMALLSELHQNEQGKGLKQQVEQNRVKNIIEKVIQDVSDSPIYSEEKAAYLKRLSAFDAQLLENTCQTAKEKLTGMDMKYILCFLTDVDVKNISLLFNVEPASVYTVRYRVKKKLSKDDPLVEIL